MPKSERDEGEAFQTSSRAKRLRRKISTARRDEPGPVGQTHIAALNHRPDDPPAPNNASAAGTAVAKRSGLPPAANLPPAPDLPPAAVPAASPQPRARWSRAQKREAKRQREAAGESKTSPMNEHVHDGREGTVPATEHGDCGDAAAAVPTPKARRPLLVLLDLNGTLVHRDTATAPFVVRPGALPLLLDLTLCKHVDLGFCTSMQPKNARRAIKALVEAAEVAAEEAAAEAVAEAAAEAVVVRSLLRRALPQLALFAGDDFHFRNDVGLPLLPLRVPSLAPWRLLRNLSRIWADPRAQGHTATSTVLVDDTPGKCPLSPSSVLIVETWCGAHSDEGACAASRAVLGRLTDYLLAASQAQAATGEAADVRAWLASHPFKGGGVGEGTADVENVHDD